MTESKVVALFDFDGTITHRDSLLPFLWQLFGPLKLAGYAISMSPLLLGYLLRVIPNGIAKERLLGRMLEGMNMADLIVAAEHFSHEFLPRIVRRESAERIAWHQQQGHRVIIVSASLELYLKPWAASLGVTDVIATRLQVEQGKVLSQFDGVNCFGEVKAQRVQEYLGDMSGLEVYAYGDSRGDTQMLALADHAYYRGVLRKK